jgi:acyl-CoA synthetase (AMP-forming)/AMP-acid ligase II
MTADDAGRPVNVARRLDEFAKSRPHAIAVAAARPGSHGDRTRYRTATFAELAADVERIAAGLRAWGVPPGARLALLVKPGVDFVTLVFALLKAGVVQVLIDPGMGRKNLLRCLEETKPDGFVAIPAAQVVRTLFGRRFPQARWNVTVGGRRWFWNGKTLDEIRALGDAAAEPLSSSPLTPAPLPGVPGRGVTEFTFAEDPAAIIFTTGSTGPPKGVLYRHGNFDKQVEEIRDRYAIEPGEVNLACFPLFGLFNAAMGVTTVVPDMDASRPARVDPRNIVSAVQDWSVTQSFASPAVWDKVSTYCLANNVKLPTLKAAYSAGAPVAPRVLERTLQCLGDSARMHTPYGATEALPIASIEATEVLHETAHATAAGHGTCVGTKFPRIEWKIIRIVDGPICTIDRAEELPLDETGELIVKGPVVTERYVTRTEANATAKIHDCQGYWHRMGDAGYLDEHGRFWFCGRVSHCVVTAEEVMFSDPVEGVINRHPNVFRSALVGIGTIGRQQPVLIVQPIGLVKSEPKLFDELREIATKYQATHRINTFLVHPSFPVDIRHNSKIFREQLAVWAAKKLGVDNRQSEIRNPKS